jgi:hypothetical protein
MAMPNSTDPASAGIQVVLHNDLMLWYILLALPAGVELLRMQHGGARRRRWIPDPNGKRSER